MKENAKFAYKKGRKGRRVRIHFAIVRGRRSFSRGGQSREREIWAELGPFHQSKRKRGRREGARTNGKEKGWGGR